MSRHGVILVVSVLFAAASGALGVHYVAAHARREATASAIVSGRVAKRAVAEIYVDPLPESREPGWRGHLQHGGDVVFTWSSGKQESVLGGGGKPCVVGCVYVYATAMQSHQAAFAKSPETVPKDPDTTGDVWVSEAAACARACGPDTALVWPPVADGGAK